MKITLGKVQFRVMKALWAEGEATARQLAERLSFEEPMMLSTVQTLLRQLEAKDAVTHEKLQRTFVFRPLVAEHEVSRSAARDLLERVYAGSLSGLVANLLEDQDISSAELSHLRQLIETKEREIQERGS